MKDEFLRVARVELGDRGKKARGGDADRTRTVTGATHAKSGEDNKLRRRSFAAHLQEQFHKFTGEKGGDLL
jgi:hypothetical protein